MEKQREAQLVCDLMIGVLWSFFNLSWVSGKFRVIPWQWIKNKFKRFTSINVKELFSSYLVAAWRQVWIDGHIHRLRWVDTQRSLWTIVCALKLCGMEGVGNTMEDVVLPQVVCHLVRIPPDHPVQYIFATGDTTSFISRCTSSLARWGFIVKPLRNCPRFWFLKSSYIVRVFIVSTLLTQKWRVSRSPYLLPFSPPFPQSIFVSNYSLDLFCYNLLSASTIRVWHFPSGVIFEGFIVF